MNKIYIASPYTIGDTLVNVHRQMFYANELLCAGLAPFIPLLCHYQNELYPLDYDTWMEWDKVWIRSCDGLLRLSGESKGADEEVAYAKKFGIPVFYSVKSVLKYFHKD